MLLAYCTVMVKVPHLLLLVLLALPASSGLAALGQVFRSQIAGTATGSPIDTAETSSLPHVQTPELTSQQQAVVWGRVPFLLATLGEDLAKVDHARYLVEGAPAAFGRLSESTRHAVIDDWRGFAAYSAIQRTPTVEFADWIIAGPQAQPGARFDAIERLPATLQDVVRSVGTRPGVTRFERVEHVRRAHVGLGDLLTELERYKMLSDLAESKSMARRLVRLHGFSSPAIVPFDVRMIGKADIERMLRKADLSAERAMLEDLANSALVSDIPLELAVRAAQTIATPDTSPIWIRNQLQLMREQARLVFENQHRDGAQNAGREVERGGWLPDQSARFEGHPLPYSRLDLLGEFNRTQTHAFAYDREQLRNTLSRLAAIDDPVTPSAEVAKLAQAGLRMLHDNAALGATALDALAASWADAPLLSDLAERAAKLRKLSRDTNALLKQRTLSKNAYLAFVDQYLQDFEEASLVQTGPGSRSNVFVRGVTRKSDIETFPLPSIGAGYWGFDDAYQWFADAIMRDSTSLDSLVLPAEVPLAGRVFDGVLGGPVEFAAHDVAHTVVIKERMTRHLELAVNRVHEVRRAESVRDAMRRAGELAEADQLDKLITSAKKAFGEAFWETKPELLDHPVFDQLPARVGGAQ